MAEFIEAVEGTIHKEQWTMNMQERYAKYLELDAAFQAKNNPLIDRWAEAKTQAERDAINEQAAILWDEFNMLVDELYNLETNQPCIS